MARCNLTMNVTIKHVRLLFWLNVLLVLFGIKPIVPNWFVRRNISITNRCGEMTGP
jgi:hypothetical protein